MCKKRIKALCFCKKCKYIVNTYIDVVLMKMYIGEV